MSQTPTSSSSRFDPLRALVVFLALTLTCSLAWSQEDEALTRPPAATEGAATEVRFGLYLVDIFSLDDVDESFSADFVVLLHWSDPRLAGRWKAEAQIPRASIWSPTLQIVNDKDLRTLLPETLQVDSEGGVTYRQRFKGTLTTDLNLHHFPLDSQDLLIQAVLIGNTLDEVQLMPDPTWSGMRDQVSLGGWRLELGELEGTVEQFAAQNRLFSRVDQHILVERDVSYFFYKGFLPLVLILFMAWTVFWIDPTNVNPRFSISASSVFTLIAFRLGLGTTLPKVSYLTRADLFILGGTLLVFAALAETVWSARWAKQGHLNRASRADAIARVLFPILAIGIFFFTLGTA